MRDPLASPLGDVFEVGCSMPSPALYLAAIDPRLPIPADNRRSGTYKAARSHGGRRGKPIRNWAGGRRVQTGRRRKGSKGFDEAQCCHTLRDGEATQLGGTPSLKTTETSRRSELPKRVR